MPLEVIDLGLVEYEKAWKLQDEYAREIAKGRRPTTLLLLEHPHVYTFGRRGKPENLLWGESQLRKKEIAIHWVDRGGDVTYHGPGQLVGYPLIPLTPIPFFQDAGEKGEERIGSARGTFDEPARVVWKAPPELTHAMALTCGDLDHDGDLDLFLAQYKPPYAAGSMPTPVHDARDGLPAYFLRNDGTGHFTDITPGSGLEAKRHRRTYSASFVISTTTVTWTWWWSATSPAWTSTGTTVVGGSRT